MPEKQFPVVTVLFQKPKVLAKEQLFYDSRKVILKAFICQLLSGRDSVFQLILTSDAFQVGRPLPHSVSHQHSLTTGMCCQFIPSVQRKALDLILNLDIDFNLLKRSCAILVNLGGDAKAAILSTFTC